jgi:hypothetical protein
LVKLGFDGQCPESIGITLKSWFDAYAESLAHPAAPVPLTDEQIEKISDSIPRDAYGVQAPIDFARAIEAAHGITKGQP